MSLRDDLIRDEDVRTFPYKDTLNVLTIGVGRNLTDVGITHDEAIMMLDNDIRRVEDELDKELSWWRSQPQKVQRGLANMCFQLGLSGLKTFHMALGFLNKNDYAAAREAFSESLWAKQTPERAKRVIELMNNDEGELT